MGNRFYFRMATTNILLNRRFYAPYLLTCVISVAMYFIISSMALTDLPGGNSMVMIMTMGQVVIALFCGIFLFYTNSFLMKRRKRELALYNILGLEKRHILIILFDEMFLTALVSIGGGLLFGVVLDKLMYLVLLNIMHFDVTQSFQLYPAAFLSALKLFGVIFLLILAANLAQIVKARPIELLHGEAAGEQEPKVKWLLVMIGAVCLAVGYYLAVTTEDVLAALLTFFVAVILVIIGTYCLFTAGSIAVLKTMKRNRSYYYKPQHFVSVSGMLYRMKQNAIGLGNICILSTMVLVTVSTTMSLYVGLEEIFSYQYPSDIQIGVYNATPEEKTQLLETVEDNAQQMALPIDELTAYESLQFSLDLRDGDTLVADSGRTDASQITYLLLLTPENYQKVTGESLSLGSNEVVLYEQSGHLPDNFTMFDTQYTVVQRLDKRPVTQELGGYIGVNVNYLVVDSDETFQRIYEAQKAAYGEHASDLLYTVQYDLNATNPEIVDVFHQTMEQFETQLSESRDGEAYSFRSQCRPEGVQDGYAFYGSFLFLGLFMGILFSMAAVLIIYYKQLIEGYEDRGRFEIMQNVGMDDRLIRSSIRSQILTMFFLPLAMAAIHVCFAFPLLTRLMDLLYLNNVRLFAMCTVGTVLVFAVIYGLVYTLTSRTYYKIISGASERQL